MFAGILPLCSQLIMQGTIGQNGAAERLEHEEQKLEIDYSCYIWDLRLGTPQEHKINWDLSLSETPRGAEWLL